MRNGAETEENKKCKGIIVKVTISPLLIRRVQLSDAMMAIKTKRIAGHLPNPDRAH